MKKILIKNKKIEEQEGFFCSELVAALYKKLQLLPEHVSACAYWPGRFSMNKKLELRDGAYFGPELAIEFELS